MAIRWYRRIFWKVFLSVWLTSFLVLLLTAFVVGNLAEKERYAEVLTARALGHAELIVDRYERTGIVPRPELRKERRHYDEDNHDEPEWREHRERRFFPLKIQITELSSGRMIVGKRLEGRFRNPLVLKFESERGKRYRVVVESDLRKTLFAKVFGFMLSLQIVLLVLVSTFAALLISWIVVRPINRLRQHTRDLYSGDLSARTDDQLAARGDEIGELSREFNRMADYVEQTLQSNQRLLQDVSHELRAPLARLQMAVGLAEQKVADIDRAVIDRINLECERINRLIDEILSLSRLEQMGASGQPFLVQQVIDSLVEDYRFSAPDHLISWNNSNSCQLPGNPELLSRALTNILGNAVKHTPAGTGIDILLDHGKAGGCQIIIRDHGPGVEADQLERLFKPFYRVSDRHNGYGLGLSIAQRAVVLLGGKISASSTPGEGLVFQIDLPGP
ncbi:sensor histidine kinase [Amphritea sp. HPY]|uniref:sensor histidine kinase n=1 Tax=Amphritea sp. HPY TaxID=3421652 RepID=UPI003D7E579E